jgi:hypothetical protein
MGIFGCSGTCSYPFDLLNANDVHRPRMDSMRRRLGLPLARSRREVVQLQQYQPEELRPKGLFEPSLSWIFFCSLQRRLLRTFDIAYFASEFDIYYDNMISSDCLSCGHNLALKINWERCTCHIL